MALLQNHLDQISATARSIQDIEFPVSRPFTNALLDNQEITALIRDIEPHERGLFTTNTTVKNGTEPASGKNSAVENNSRRRTAYGVSTVQSSAVARVLGSDLLKKIQSSDRDGGRGRRADIEVLLQGAEKLCGAFDVPGAMERIQVLRARHRKISVSIAKFEEQVSHQQSSLSHFQASDDVEDGQIDQRVPQHDQSSIITEQDIDVEEEAVRALEARKRALETRVAGIKEDIGTLRG